MPYTILNDTLELHVLKEYITPIDDLVRDLWVYKMQYKQGAREVFDSDIRVNAQVVNRKIKIELTLTP